MKIENPAVETLVNMQRRLASLQLSQWFGSKLTAYAEVMYMGSRKLRSKVWATTKERYRPPMPKFAGEVSMPSTVLETVLQETSTCVRGIDGDGISWYTISHRIVGKTGSINAHICLFIQICPQCICMDYPNDNAHDPVSWMSFKWVWTSGLIVSTLIFLNQVWGIKWL